MRRGTLLIDVGCLLILLVAGLTGLLGTFGAGSLGLAAGWGLILGTVIAVLGARLRWDVAVIAAATVAGYALLAGPILTPDAVAARVLPTPAAWRELALAAVRSWRDVLTIPPPLDGRATLLAVPAILALLGSVTAVSLVLRLRRPWWSLVPVAVVLVSAGLLGSADAAGVLVRGAVLAAVALGWAAWRTRADAASRALEADAGAGHPTHPAPTDRRVAALAMLAVAVVGGTALAPLTAATGQRYTLREDVVPPFRLEDQVSPLQAYRGWVRDHSEDVMLTVSDLPEGARVRLAAMDGYDGMVYDVTEGAHGGSFISTTADLPAPALPVTGQEVAARITVGEYTGIWVPTLGEPTRVQFTGTSQELAREQQRGLYADPGSGVAVTVAGLRPGDSYQVAGVVPAVPSDDQLAGRSLAAVEQPELAQVPAVIASAAPELAGEEGDAITRLRTLQNTLATTGYFSHGLEGEAPSRSGHGAERITAFLTEDAMVGDDEQYATTMALAARQLGMPARVVMGFYPSAGVSGEVALTGEDLHVWTEVAFDTYGWVAFDPTPSQDREPQDTATEPKSNPKPQVLQPPPQPEEPAKEPPVSAQDTSSSDEETEEPPTGPGLGLWLALGAAGLVVLGLAPALVVLAAKALRRRRRVRAPQPVDRIAGGWHEVMDTATDLGIVVPASATRRQSARLLPAAGATMLAERADTHVFGAGDPADAEAVELWQQVEGVVAQLRGSVGWWARLRSRLSVRSLRARRRSSRSVPRLAPGGRPAGSAAPPAGPAQPARREPSLPAEPSAPQEERTVLAVGRTEPAELHLDLDTGERVAVQGTGVLGRDPVAPAPAQRIALPDPSRTLSKNHLGFGVAEGRLWVEDLHSTNGSFLDEGQGERRLEPGVRTFVAPGGIIRCGDRTVTVAAR